MSTSRLYSLVGYIFLLLFLVSMMLFLGFSDAQYVFSGDGVSIYSIVALMASVPKLFWLFFAASVSSFGLALNVNGKPIDRQADAN
jgi:hypothetical protein